MCAVFVYSIGHIMSSARISYALHKMGAQSDIHSTLEEMWRNNFDNGEYLSVLNSRRLFLQFG